MKILIPGARVIGTTSVYYLGATPIADLILNVGQGSNAGLPHGAGFFPRPSCGERVVRIRAANSNR
jgi:hypothetical protein